MWSALACGLKMVVMCMVMVMHIVMLVTVMPMRALCLKTVSSPVFQAAQAQGDESAHSLLEGLKIPGELKHTKTE